MILWNVTIPLIVQVTDAVLSAWVTLLGCLAVPVLRRLPILVHLSAVLVSIPESDLGLDVALVGMDHCLHEGHILSSGFVLKVIKSLCGVVSCFCTLSVDGVAVIAVL